jgi:hypothetical protein
LPDFRENCRQPSINTRRTVNCLLVLDSPSTGKSTRASSGPTRGDHRTRCSLATPKCERDARAPLLALRVVGWTFIPREGFRSNLRSRVKLAVPDTAAIHTSLMDSIANSSRSSGSTPLYPSGGHARQVTMTEKSRNALIFGRDYRALFCANHGCIGHPVFPAPLLRSRALRGSRSDRAGDTRE